MHPLIRARAGEWPVRLQREGGKFLVAARAVWRGGDGSDSADVGGRDIGDWAEMETWTPEGKDAESLFWHHWQAGRCVKNSLLS